VNARPRLPGGAGESAGVAERLHDPAPVIDEAAEVGIGPGELGDPDAIDLLDRRAAPAPVLGGQDGSPQRRPGMAGLEPAILTRIALDAVTPHEVEDEVRRAADQLGQPRAPLRPERRLELARIELQSGNHLAPVAPGRARADQGGLEQRHGRAPLGGVERRREPGESPPDDADVGPLLSAERRVGGRRRGGSRPQRAGMLRRHELSQRVAAAASGIFSTFTVGCTAGE
jgi:hypothetical protein